MKNCELFTDDLYVIPTQDIPGIFKVESAEDQEFQHALPEEDA